MKLIDEKGRLFGKINLFDLFVLIVIVGVGFFGYTRFIAPPYQVSTQATKEITYQLFIHNVRSVTTNTIQEGDRIRHFETNLGMGEIISKEIMPAKKMVNTEDGAIVEAEIPERYDMLLTVKGQGVVSDREIVLGDKAIRLGALVKVRTNKYEVETTVFGIEYEE